MKLHAYAAMQASHLNEFTEWWAAMNKANPGVYPIDNRVVDWDEQFELYVALAERDDL